MPLIDCQIISTGQRVGFWDTSNKKITLYVKQHEKMCRKTVSGIVLIFCLRQLSLLKDVQHFWCMNWVQFWIDELVLKYQTITMLCDDYALKCILDLIALVCCPSISPHTLQFNLSFFVLLALNSSYSISDFSGKLL